MDSQVSYKKADLLSRFVNKDDRSVNPSVFRLVDDKWGPHTFNRFAAYNNAQLPRFNSKFASPGCSGVDALVQDWSGENNWLCPRVCLIIDSIRLLMSCSGRGTLIIPEWPSAHFWPILRAGSSNFKSFVVEVFVLPAIIDRLLEGPGQKQIYRSRPSVFRGCPKFRMLALRLDFRQVMYLIPMLHVFRPDLARFGGPIWPMHRLFRLIHLSTSRVNARMRNERVIAIAECGLGWSFGSVVNFRACAVNEF